jgi:sialic acid synthase SpsE
VKGPAGGILPKYLELIIGKKSSKIIKADFPITWADF